MDETLMPLGVTECCSCLLLFVAPLGVLKGSRAEHFYE